MRFQHVGMRFACLLVLLAPSGALALHTGVRAPLPAATQRASLRLAADEPTGKEAAARVAWPGTPLQAIQHLPLLALPSVASYYALPMLYDTWQAAALNSQEKLGTFIALLLTKRLTL